MIKNNYNVILQIFYQKNKKKTKQNKQKNKPKNNYTCTVELFYYFWNIMWFILFSGDKNDIY